MFWQSISTLLEGYRIGITVQKNTNGTLTAIIIPKLLKEDKEGLAPISLTGTPEEFDSAEMVTVIKNALLVAKEKFANVNMFISALEALEKKKKDELDKKKKENESKPKSSSTASKVAVKKKTIQVPNPDYIPVDKRNAENEDYDPDTYDEDEPEMIDEEVDEPAEETKQTRLI